MKKILTQIFVALGVIFLILILIGVYFFVTDPFNLKPLLFGTVPVKTQTQNTPVVETTAITPDTPAVATTPAGGFQLSNAQKQALTAFGIDPATVPSSINPKQETCFISVLGQARVTEIKAGAVPNALEFLKAKSCIQ